MRNSLYSGFVKIDNLVAELLMALEDTEKRRYYVRSLQGVLNAVRQINLFYASEYKEVVVDIGNSLKSGAYPIDCVKAITVGINRNGEFAPFTKKNNMARTAYGLVDDEAIGESGIYDTGATSGLQERADIPQRGIKYGAIGANEGYWVDDEKNRRFFVSNYSLPKVIFRYRSNGLTCTSDNCIPYYAKDLIISMVSYDFAIRGVPRKYTAAELYAFQQERARHYDEYTSLLYEPQNLYEVMDTVFSSYNITPGR